MFSQSRIAIGMLLGALTLATCWMALAKTDSKTRAITVTGCLQKGTVADRYHLFARNGKAYSLRSSSVALGDHVGHSVTIKGELKHDSKRDDYDFEGSEVDEEYGKGKVANFLDVEVVSLKMNSASCPVASGK